MNSACLVGSHAVLLWQIHDPDACYVAPGVSALTLFTLRLITALWVCMVPLEVDRSSKELQSNGPMDLFGASENTLATYYEALWDSQGTF